MTKHYRRLLIATVIALAFLVESALADTYYDYAEVLSTTPVTQTVRGQAERQVCRTLDVGGRFTTARPVPPDVVRSGQGYGLVDIIRQDLAVVPRTVRECETVSRPETRTVGFRVRYRYGNRTYTRTVAEPPGDRIRVRVEVDRQ